MIQSRGPVHVASEAGYDDGRKSLAPLLDAARVAINLLHENYQCKVCDGKGWYEGTGMQMGRDGEPEPCQTQEQCECARIEEAVGDVAARLAAELGLKI